MTASIVAFQAPRQSFSAAHSLLLTLPINENNTARHRKTLHRRLFSVYQSIKERETANARKYHQAAALTLSCTATETPKLPLSDHKQQHDDPHMTTSCPAPHHLAQKKHAATHLRAAACQKSRKNRCVTLLCVVRLHLMQELGARKSLRINKRLFTNPF